ncbi:MAG: phosphonate C-P lyase system protein PhnL [Polaromonas sp.]|uniref:phosphonate C-P lyase system protein PhnL n=1 Tax=Polaromonas sp. TaxID=1869339 RepID=UPI002734100F|nr:phosphonate C-P lyase system protein PhnL [Polaromonas sp.]MDP2817820.1 phosphonate C-P lyase system protein PhnL [Polaromonas sp.]
MTALLETTQLSKTFTLHGRGGLALPVFSGINLSVFAGECLALTGHSGSGKSSLLRCLYGNYGASAGEVRVRHDDAWVRLSQAAPREVLEVRRRTLGYVSQFLRVIPRVSTLDIVAEPLRRLGVAADDARAEAAQWLARLNLQERLWHLPPATFSGGEQQRVNIAHGLIASQPVLLLDEPTASLDADNRAVVVDLIRAARARGAAIVGIFHDDEVREAVASRCFDVEQHRPSH